jgi:fatty acid desaturase
MPRATPTNLSILIVITNARCRNDREDDVQETSMTDMAFVTRDELADFEWDNQRKDWKRPELDRAILKDLSERSTLNGLIRIGYFVLLLTLSAIATLFAARIHVLLAIPVLYIYYFFYGFWVAIGHELQHKTVFAKSADWFSEVFYFFVQTIMWNSPRYARISHKLHHRYTMVRGVDPETDWPEVVTSKALRKVLFTLISQILVVGAVWSFMKMVAIQVKRIAGVKSPMMRDHCSKKDIVVIRIESLAILLIHVSVIVVALWLRRWELIVFITIAWQIGSPIEGLWHNTKHIGRPYNVNDHRLNTRSIRVSRFVNLIFWGLDDHVDHHLYPIVPSRNLPKLHKELEDQLPLPNSIFGCWAEMFTITREKDSNPDNEYVAVDIAK